MKAALLLMLLLAGCAAGTGASGPYVGGSLGAGTQENQRLR